MATLSARGIGAPQDDQHNRQGGGSQQEATFTRQTETTPMVAAARGVGKSTFVEEVLSKNKTANSKTINEAWKAAGREGTISSTLVQKMRARMGLSGNL